MTVIDSLPANGHSNAVTRRATVMGSLADRYQMDPQKLLTTLKSTCIKGHATDEQVAAFCIVANRYGLDPFLKEIHAFASQGGGIVPIVGIDGWAKIASSHASFDGCAFEFSGEGDELACTCTVHVKDRAHPIRVTEYLAECKRNTPPWNQYKRRMLRHRAYIQAIRLAFGVGGIFDEDEARDVVRNESGDLPVVHNDAPSIAARIAAVQSSSPPSAVPPSATEPATGPKPEQAAEAGEDEVARIKQLQEQARKQGGFVAPEDDFPESTLAGDINDSQVQPDAETELTMPDPCPVDWINDMIVVKKPSTITSNHAARKTFHGADVASWDKLPRERQQEKFTQLMDGTFPWKGK